MMIVTRSHPPVRALVGACLLLAATGVALATPIAAAVPSGGPDLRTAKSIHGTVNWKTVTQSDRTYSDASGPDERQTSTTVDEGTLSIVLRRISRSPSVFVVDGQGSRYDYSFSGDRTIASGGCTATTTSHATASGTFPRFTTTIHPSLAANVVPGVNPASIGPKTKGLVLLPGISYLGTSTTTDVGASPCLNGTQTQAIGGDAVPSDSPLGVCYPRGITTRAVSPEAGQLVGVWRQATQRFVFDCSTSRTTADGDVITTTVTGSLRYG